MWPGQTQTDSHSLLQDFIQGPRQYGFYDFLRTHRGEDFLGTIDLKRQTVEVALEK